jgi:hypothetical protein
LRPEAYVAACFVCNLSTHYRAGLVDLFEALPAGGGEGCGENMQAVSCGVFGGSFKPEFEAVEASRTALGSRG